MVSDACSPPVFSQQAVLTLLCLVHALVEVFSNHVKIKETGYMRGQKKVIWERWEHISIL